MRGSTHNIASLAFITSLVFISLRGPGFAQEPSLNSVPVPAGAALEYSRYEGRENLRAEYRIPLAQDLTVPQVGDRVIEEAQKYLEEMKRAGWNLTKEAWHTRQGEFSFRRGVLLDAGLHIHPAARPMEGKMHNFVAFTFHLVRRLPYEDITGCDPVDVPRYPGSVRIRFMNLLGDFATKYLVQASLGEVRKYFEENLPEFGWEEMKGAGTLNYRKGGWKTPEDARPSIQPGDPVSVAENAIPTTLSLHLSEDEGLVEIGVGRAAGAPDRGKIVEGSLTPPLLPEKPAKTIFTRIDPVEDLPVYPGLVRTSGRTLPVNLAGEEITRIVYEKADAEMKEALEVAEFYIDEFKKKGWVLLDEEWHGLRRKLLWRNEAVQVLVEVQAVGRYPLPERPPRIRIPVQVDVIHPLPRRDVAGKDLEGIPRYAGSVRCYYLKAGIDEIVKFKAVGTVSRAEQFFIRELPQKGWTFSGNDQTGLLFVPSSTAKSAAGALASGQLVPTTLKVKIDDTGNETVRIGMDLTKGG